MIHTILESGDKKNKIGDEFNTLLFSTIFHIKRKKERKKETKHAKLNRKWAFGIRKIRYMGKTQNILQKEKRQTTQTAIFT
jgi:hypothetical protein